MDYSIFADTMANKNWMEIEEKSKAKVPVLFPLGVIEEHGPHLPLGTDIYLSYAICKKIKEELNKKKADCLIVPPYYWGINHCTEAFPSIRQMIRGLQGWLADLKEKRQAFLEELEEMREPTLPELLSRYMSLRQEERTGWTGKGRLKGSVADFNKVMEAVDLSLTERAAEQMVSRFIKISVGLEQNTKNEKSARQPVISRFEGL